MPILKFDTHLDNQTILQLQVWHKCIDIITETLKCVANTGSFLANLSGNIRYCFTPLVGWITDLPEHK